MGGPFWARKDAGAWSLPKGEHGPEEDPLAAAVREFAEELGSPPPPGTPRELGTVRQPSAPALMSARVFLRWTCWSTWSIQVNGT